MGLSLHGLVVIALGLAAFVLYSRPRIPMETTSLGVLVSLALMFALFPYHGPHGAVSPMLFFRGFSNGALIAIVSLMIAGQALVRTGALVPLARLLTRLWKYSAVLGLLLVLLTTAVLSAFINDTPLVILLIPVLTQIARDTKRSVSGILMPLGFSALIGGMGTTIGTSTNLLVVAVARQEGLPAMGMFHFTPVAAIAAGVGLLYLWLIAPRLLPERQSPASETSARRFRAMLELGAESRAIGQTIEELDALAPGLKVQRVLRGDVTLFVAPGLAVREGDRLVLEDRPTALKEAEKALGGQLFIGETAWKDETLPEDDQQLAELGILPASGFVGRSLRQAALQPRFEVTPLGIYRHGAALKSKAVDDEVLRPGDVVLVQGAKEDIDALRQSSHFVLLDATSDLPRGNKAILALLFMAVIVVPAALNWLPIEVTAPVGMLAMVASGCIKWDEIGAGVSATVILLIATGFALSNAMVHTDAASFLAHAVVGATSALPPGVTLALVLFFVALLGNAASHTTAALVGAPIAAQIAHLLHLSPEPFLLAVLFGANLGYATPMAYQTNVLVMNAAGYSFADFMRVGLPLLVLMGGLLSVLIPLFFPFK
ncbi:MAG: SLC13 family permease [Rhodospirillales bacterium]|nr:SLC13 family permease [Rhodospirillales bacterium]